MASFRNRRIVGATSGLTGDDWKDIFSHQWTEKYRLVLEVVRSNNNQPTSIEEIRKSLPNFYIGGRDRINDVFRRLRKPYFLANVGYGTRDARFQVVRRS
jgi:hypothetical protein